MRGHNAQQELVDAELNLTRARAALAEEQRNKQKTDLREAIQRGRQLKAEYDRVAKLFGEARDRAKQWEALVQNLSDRAAAAADAGALHYAGFPLPRGSEPVDARLATGCLGVRRCAGRS